MKAAYYCVRYQKLISKISDAERNRCKMTGNSCAVCKRCKLRNVSEVRHE